MAGDVFSNSTASTDSDIDHWTSTQTSAGNVQSGSLSDVSTSNDGYYVLVETRATSGGPLGDRNYLLAWRFDFTSLETTRTDTKIYIEANTSGENFRTYWGPDTSTHNAISSCDVSAISDTFYVCDIPDDTSANIYIFFLDNNDAQADATDTSTADTLGIDKIVLETTITILSPIFIRPNLGDNGYSNTTSVQFNVTAGESLDIALVETEGSNYTTDRFNLTSAGRVHTYASEGVKTYRMFVNDTDGNGNYTETRTITIDTTQPSEIEFVSPTPDPSSIIRDPTPSIVIVFTETNPYNCIFQWNNGTETNFTNSSIGSNDCTFDFNTSDEDITITVFVNDSASNINSTASRSFTVDAVFLNVTLVAPSLESMVNIVQNATFLVNSTVYCIGGSCGTVTGTIQYNDSSIVPDNPINITTGGFPFYINETSPTATKTCSSDPMEKDDFCNLSWIINATGVLNGNWDIGVLFNSTSTYAIDNYTDNATIEIVPCVADVTTHFNSIQFGELTPSSIENPAPDNDGHEYNITINSGSCNTDLYIRGTNLRNETLDVEIDIRNMTFSNTTNDYSNSFNITTDYQILKLDIPETENATTYYWFNVPPVYPGSYNGTITISGVKNGDTP